MGIPQVPAVLKNKFIIGDHEQVTALRDYEEKYTKHFGDGEQKRFNVFVEIEYSDTMIVFAGSEQEAREKAEGEFNTFAIDYDISFYAKADEAENDIKN